MDVLPDFFAIVSNFITERSKRLARLLAIFTNAKPERSKRFLTISKILILEKGELIAQNSGSFDGS